MNNFEFYVLGNYSPNIRTFGELKSSCYMLKGFEKTIFLDFGAGVFSEFKTLVEKKEIKLDNILIIISHNHIDHNFSLLELYYYVKKYNKDNNKNVKIDVIMPKRSVLYTMADKSDVFNIIVLNENLNFYVGEVEFSFCPTIHKGESYATKISYKDKVFVYTSDIARFSKKLRNFIKGAGVVMADAGYPHKRLKIFRNYHGITKEILKEMSNLCIPKVYITHIRFFAHYNDYIESCPVHQNVEIIFRGNTYQMFR